MIIAVYFFLYKTNKKKKNKNESLIYSRLLLRETRILIHITIYIKPDLVYAIDCAQ